MIHQKFSKVSNKRAPCRFNAHAPSGQDSNTVKTPMSTSSSAESVSSPEVVSESRGSSVSTGLREEYEDLLRYAVVTPVLNASTVKSSKVLKNQSSGGPPPRSSPPPRPHTPPRHLSRSEPKAKGT